MKITHTKFVTFLSNNAEVCFCYIRLDDLLSKRIPSVVYAMYIKHEIVYLHLP